MTSRIDSKRAFLAALTAVAIAFALVLVAWGSPASAEDVDSWPISSETNHESFWEEWGAETHGEIDWACTKDDRGGQGAFVLEQEPEEGAFWRLLVLKAGSDRVDLHWNPLSGASFEHSVKGGWSHVILCSRPLSETEPGKIIVKKEVTAGSDVSKVFTFFESGFTLDDNTLAHGEMGMSGDVEPGGDYSVSETVPTGWTLLSATCDGDSTPADINVEEGETVTCTFVNIEDEVSPTSIVSTTTTIVSTTTTIVGATTTIVSTTVEVSDETLPFTGFENGTSGLLALMLVASGALALVGTRVFRRETDE
jgi:hypothetical protein